MDNKILCGLSEKQTIHNDDDDNDDDDDEEEDEDHLYKFALFYFQVTFYIDVDANVRSIVIKWIYSHIMKTLFFSTTSMKFITTKIPF